VKAEEAMVDEDTDGRDGAGADADADAEDTTSRVK
jgi:hypothetical protein